MVPTVPVSSAVVDPGGGADPLEGGGPVVQAGVQVKAEEQVGGNPYDSAKIIALLRRVC